MISIVLPVYNGEKFLRESIESILTQTYRDFELVIVNDCSTDDSVKIVNEYMKKDSRIKLINNDKNQKLPNSLNIGFSNCKGDYYTWTSDDNIMLSNALEIMISTLKNKDVDLVFSRCDTIDSKGKVTGKTPIWRDLDDIYYKNIVLASFLYKKEIHEKLNGYDTNKFLVEDYDFWLRAYRSFKFAYIPEVLYKIRYHGNNLGFKRLEDVKLRNIMLLKENLNYISDKDIEDKINKEISNSYFEISNAYYLKINKEKEKKDILKKRIKDNIKKLIRKR
ncbi:glycosyltransferase family 2 protein [Agathobacter sp. LCP21S3_B2]|uniref:glycosyltransferase family 2 protein n=1 Tax=Agathobacter sp. LCP21S3_B2 TaxID=3438734 RepID=UPI003F913E54